MKITSFEDIYKFYGKTGTIEDFKNNFNIYKEKLSETIKYSDSIDAKREADYRSRNDRDDR